MKGGPEAFIFEREFAHIHPRPNPSWHLQLPPELAILAISAGWGEIHPVTWYGVSPANSLMLYSPRNAEELEVVRSKRPIETERGRRRPDTGVSGHHWDGEGDVFRGPFTGSSLPSRASRRWRRR